MFAEFCSISKSCDPRTGRGLEIIRRGDQNVKEMTEKSFLTEMLDFYLKELCERGICKRPCIDDDPY